jgi:hypothetical protein
VTISILQYVRERRYSQASIPDGQLALWDIVFELARRVDALESGAAQNGSGKVLYEGEAAVLKDGLLLPREAVLGLRGRHRVRVVIYAESEAQS